MQKNDNFTVTDQRKQPFTIVENGVIDSMSFEKPIDKLLYISISRFSHMQSIYPSMGTLMLMCGINSVNTLKAALKRLKEMKLINFINRGRKDNGEHNTHEYILYEVPETILENSVFKQEKVQEKKAEIKDARKEKAEKTNHNKHKKKVEIPAEQGTHEGPSNFDGGISNFDGGPSNFDGGPSNFEHKKKESINQEVMNQEVTNKEYLSILENIKKLDVPTHIVSVLKNQIDRLILHKVKLNQIEILFHQYRDKMGHNDFASILEDVLQVEKYNKGFKPYMDKSINNFLTNRSEKGKADGQPKPVRKEYVPDDFDSWERAGSQGSSYQGTDLSRLNFRKKNSEEAAEEKKKAMWEKLVASRK